LRSAGLGGILSKPTVSHEEALKAFKILQRQGEISKAKAGSELWHRASASELKDQTAREEKKNKNLRTYLAMDVGEQLQREALEEEAIKYTKRSFHSLTEKIEYEKKLRESKIAEEKNKRSRFTGSPVKPQLPVITSLPDMDIG
jgi:hypothetical protein